MSLGKQDLTIVCVTYNSSRVIKDFVDSIDAGVNIVLVDNASRDFAALKELAPRASILSMDANMGYGAACNAGAAASDSALLLFANPDVRFTAGSIDVLLAAANKQPDAAFNPLIHSKGRPHIRSRSRLLPGARCRPKSVSGLFPVIPVLSGACILLRREHFDRIGGFDPRIFMFHEDDDLSIRLCQIGVKLLLAGEAVVHHAAGKSSGRSLESERIKGEAMARSLVYVMKKHGLGLNIEAEKKRARLKLLLPHVMLNPARRTKLLSFLRGLDAEPVI